ncbi:MAG: DUF4136 domain-containing protein [Acidobacteriota bacterium]
MTHKTTHNTMTRKTVTQKLFTTLMLTAALTTATAASASAKVEAGFHGEANLNGYQTYSWNVDHDTNPSDIDATIRAEIEAKLAAAGLEPVETGGDLEVDFTTSATQETRVEIVEIDPHFAYPRAARPRLNRLALRMDPWYGHPWPHDDLALVDINEVHEGQLEVRLIDADSDTTVWEGTADGRVRKSAEKNAKKATKALAKMFRDFPTLPNATAPGAAD